MTQITKNLPKLFETQIKRQNCQYGNFSISVMKILVIIQKNWIFILLKLLQLKFKFDNYSLNTIF